MPLEEDLALCFYFDYAMQKISSLAFSSIVIIFKTLLWTIITLSGYVDEKDFHYSSTSNILVFF